MKIIYTFLFLFCITNSFAQKEIDITELEVKSDIFYIKGSDKQYSGSVIKLHENGKKHLEFVLDEGILNGTSTTWNSMGIKQKQGLVTNGLQEGLWTTWNFGGTKIIEEHFLKGKRDGPFVSFHSNGNKKHKSFYKQGREEGKQTSWFED